MHANLLPPSVALVRGETVSERAARHAAGTPVLAFLMIELFPKSGTAVIRETDLPGQAQADLARELAAGQWENPHRILLIDEASGICRDASAEIAQLLDADAGLSSAARDFRIRHAGASRSAA